MRTIKKIHQAEAAHMGDLITYRALPTRDLGYLDPFLLLNHHGPQVYPPDNNGLPFGPHPHRGMETVTFIIEGDISHRDNSGHESVMTAGGVQWMTAGRGIIHSETSSEAFKITGGPLEILQLWINLAARDKMCEPAYKGLDKAQIPRITADEGRVQIDLIAGKGEGMFAAFTSKLDIHLKLIHFKENGKLELRVPTEQNIFFYVIKGSVEVNGSSARKLEVVEFLNDATDLNVTAETDSLLLLGHATPLNEPVVSAGPFVMNTEKEIRQAYEDYHKGKFGSL